MSVEVKPVKKSPFDIINDINLTKSDLRNEDWFDSTYNPFLINRYMSLNQDTLLIANEANVTLRSLDKDIQYHFYLLMVSKKKRYGKYETEKSDKIVSMLSEYYNISYVHARNVVDLHTEEQLSFIEDHLQKGGKAK